MLSEALAVWQSAGTLAVRSQERSHRGHERLGAPRRVLNKTMAFLIPSQEKVAYASAFDQCDTDRDGFILATEAPALFGQSGLPSVSRC